jgi:hypothetical protein
VLKITLRFCGMTKFSPGPSLRPLRIGLVSFAAIVLVASPAAAAPPPIDLAAAQFFDTGQTGQASLDSNGTAAGDIDGAGSFGSPQTLTAGSVNNNVILGDYDEDGLLDLAVTGLGSFVVLLNDGNRQFHQSASYTLWQNPFQASGVARDFDGDGDLDLALKAVDGIRMMLGNGNGTFATGPLTTIPSSFPGEIATIDDANLDGDATVDLVAGLGGTQRAVALVGEGDGSFSLADQVFVPFVPTTVKAGDLDHDGLDDLAVLPEASPPNATAAVVLNEGAGILGSPTTPAASATPTARSRTSTATATST